MRSVVISMNVTFSLEICQHLKDLNNQVNQYFPNEKCMMLNKIFSDKRSIQNAS